MLRRAYRWALLSGTFLLVVAGGLLCIAPSAGATTASYSDPRTCSATVNSGVCISQVNAEYTGSTISFSMTVGQATDPTTDPNWTQSNGSTLVAWYIFVEGDTFPSYAAVDADLPDTNQFVGLVGTVSDPATLLCDNTVATSSFDLTANTYGVTFPADCVNDPDSIEVEAVWAYSQSGTDIQYFSPASTNCCFASADSTTTSTTSTTTASDTSSTTTSEPTTTTTIANSTTTTVGPSPTTTAPGTGGTSTTSTTSTTPVALTAASALGSSGTVTSSSTQLAFTGTPTAERVLLGVGALLVIFGSVTRWSLRRRARHVHE